LPVQFISKSDIPGLWGHAVPPRILDACRRLQQRGLARDLALSTYTRALVPQLAADSAYDLFHVRYNAKHTGAEREIFPLLPALNPPGIVAFTATSGAVTGIRSELRQASGPPPQRTVIDSFSPIRRLTFVSRVRPTWSKLGRHCARWNWERCPPRSTHGCDAWAARFTQPKFPDGSVTIVGDSKSYLA
jgi:hypothetical protein